MAEGEFTHERGAIKALMKPRNDDDDDQVTGGASAWRGKLIHLCHNCLSYEAFRQPLPKRIASAMRMILVEEISTWAELTISIDWYAKANWQFHPDFLHLQSKRLEERELHRVCRGGKSLDRQMQQNHRLFKPLRRQPELWRNRSSITQALQTCLGNRNPRLLRTLLQAHQRFRSRLQTVHLPDRQVLPRVPKADSHNEARWPQGSPIQLMLFIHDLWELSLWRIAALPPAAFPKYLP